MIRIACIAVFLILFLLFSYPVFLAELIIGKKDSRAKDYSSLHIVQWAIRVILRLSGVKITVNGKDNIPSRSCLFVSNHRSYFDILLIYAQCDDLTGFISKASLGKIPSLRVWMRYLHCLFLDRNNIRQGMKTILEAAVEVKRGISIVIFPEGKRNSGEEASLLPFKGGSFKIATKSGCPIVPVTISNSAEIFENHLPFVKKTHVILEYGKPVYPDELTVNEKKAIGETFHEIILETLRKNASAI